MTNKSIIYFALFLCGSLFFTANAGADVITVDDNLADNMLISSGQTVTGTFDINSALSGNSNYNQPYDIESATVSLKFTDDNDVAFSNSQTTTLYYNWNTCNGTQYQVQTTYDYFVDQYDAVQLTVGTQVSMDGTNWYELTLLDYQTNYTYLTNVHNHYYYYGCNCDYWGCDTCSGYYTHYVYTNYQTNNYDNTEGYTGELTIASVLDTSNLNDLSLDGQIDFTVTGTAGDIVFNNGKLTADVTPNPNPVPEPMTLALLGMGLAGLFGINRKRKI
jgi:hypothetical protein